MFAFINSIAAGGGYVGPFVVGYIREKSGSHEGGLLMMAILMFLAFLLVVFCVKNPNYDHKLLSQFTDDNEKMDEANYTQEA